RLWSHGTAVRCVHLDCSGCEWSGALFHSWGKSSRSEEDSERFRKPDSLPAPAISVNARTTRGEGAAEPGGNRRKDAVAANWPRPTDHPLDFEEAASSPQTKEVTRRRQAQSA